MPRVATTSSARSCQLPTGGKIPPSPALKFRCPAKGCLWSYSRRSDLKRHLPIHMSPEERENRMYKCPEASCNKKFLQKSNMITHHTARHTGLRPYICTQCSYCTADPSCLHRHMCDIHAYVPGSEPRKKQSAATVLFSMIEPVLPASPSSEYSDSWNSEPFSTAAPSSPSISYDEQSAFYSLPTTPDYVLHSDPPSPASSCDSSPPASPTTPQGWMWDPTFEAACSVMDDECSIVESSASLAPLTHYPAEGITFFDTGCDASLFFNVEQSPCNDSLLPPFFPTSAYDLAPSYPLDSVDVGFTSDVFNEQWLEVQV
ncbi:hypothetical protein C8F04DRAFT_153845 [Mycena alexandri]|uniref:C2H2-type domain-containing protein n=1 Tax=Mycena alexandri TaxID=1745969 RepID=A0AAD6WXC8_9AGAR|nr:hypothetical protein C8F04DRAFT_153845 [Mycena alexandri]